MATLTNSSPPDLTRRASEPVAPDKLGKALNLFALAAVPLLLIQAWTWITWLADSPRQITEFRDKDDFSWYLAIGYQVAAITACAVVMFFVIRGCLRARALTFDAMFCIAGISCYWLDATANVFQPVFFYSSQWINLQDWTNNIPLLPNPDAGRIPEAVAFTPAIYLGGLLMFVKLTCAIMRAAARKWPNMSLAGLTGIALGVGLTLDIAIELPMFMFDLWAYPGAPTMPSFPGLDGAHRYPIAEILIGMGIWAPMALMYYYCDDRGQTVMERGLAQHGTTRRTVLTQLRLIGAFNLLMIWLASFYWILGVFSQPYPEDMKPYIVNNACDAPGYSGTRYGPCPGSPDYRMPMPGSLPGPSPLNE